MKYPLRNKESGHAAPPPAATVILNTEETRPDVSAQAPPESAESQPDAPKPRADDTPGPCSPPKGKKTGGWFYFPEDSEED